MTTAEASGGRRSLSTSTMENPLYSATSKRLRAPTRTHPGYHDVGGQVPVALMPMRLGCERFCVLGQPRLILYASDSLDDADSATAEMLIPRSPAASSASALCVSDVLRVAAETLHAYSIKHRAMPLFGAARSTWKGALANWPWAAGLSPGKAIGRRHLRCPPPASVLDTAAARTRFSMLPGRTAVLSKRGLCKQEPSLMGAP